MKLKYLIATSIIAFTLVGCGGSSTVTPPNSSGNSQNQNSNGNSGNNSGGNSGGGSTPHVKIPGYIDPGIKKIKPNNTPHPHKKFSQIPIKPNLPPLPPKI